MPKLQISNKTLKLTNVLIANLNPEDVQDMAFLEKMDYYIKAKGCQPVGPMVQYTGVVETGNGEVGLNLRILRQASGYINKTEAPYTMEAELRVPNCLYVRFVGPQSMMNVAYQKLAVYAYEEGIEVTRNSYTVYVNHLENEDIVADIFMEKAYG